MLNNLYSLETHGRASLKSQRNKINAIKMKKIIKFSTTILLFVSTICEILNAQNIEQSFKTPPSSARPYTFWMWVDGNVSKEGITKDFEAMKGLTRKSCGLSVYFS